MPRELRPELLTLIATGKYGMHTTHDIKLTDESEIFLSSGEIFVDNIDKTQQYESKLKEVQGLQMSSDISSDMQELSVENVDMVIGQTLTGSVRQLDGAKTIIGAIFIDPNKPYLPENLFWDARMPCELSSGEVSDEKVDFTATSSIDVIIVAGDLISDEFAWREPVNLIPVPSSGDLGTGVGGGSDDPFGFGRLGDLDFGPRKLTM